MTIDDLRTLLDYHYWARDRVLDAVDALTPAQYTQDLGSSFKSVQETAAHILAAEIAWYERWRKEPVTTLPAAERFPDAAIVRQAWSEHESRARAFLQELGEAGINRLFAYRLVSGGEGKVTYAQSLQHVVNHSTYHRGQIVTLLRQLGAKPPESMDMVRFYRERQ